MQAETNISLNCTHYVDDEYDKDSAFRYTFFLSISKNKICCVLAESASSKIISLKTFTKHSINFFAIDYNDLKLMQQIIDEVKPSYKNKYVLIDNENCLLAPDTLCNLVELDAYYQLHKTIAENSQMAYSKLHVFNTTSIFNLRNETIKFIRFEMPTANLIHQSQLFIKAIANANIEKENKLFVNVHVQYIEVLVIHENKLQFYNTFNYDTETDFVYYILAVAEQLGIQNNANIMLYGDIANTDIAFEMLKKYAVRVQFGDKLTQYQYPEAFNKFASHQHFVLSSCLLCE